MNARALPCCATQDLARHLDREERAEAFAELVDARVAVLMAPGAAYWPLDAANLGEALTEADKPFFVKLAAALAGDVRSALGCDLMRAEAEAYWLKQATEKAEEEIKAEQKDAADRASEDRGEMRKWDLDLEMFGWGGVS